MRVGFLCFITKVILAARVWNWESDQCWLIGSVSDLTYFPVRFIVLFLFIFLIYIIAVTDFLSSLYGRSKHLVESLFQHPKLTCIRYRLVLRALMSVMYRKCRNVAGVTIQAAPSKLAIEDNWQKSAKMAEYWRKELWNSWIINVLQDKKKSRFSSAPYSRTFKAGWSTWSSYGIYVHHNPLCRCEDVSVHLLENQQKWK